MSYLYRLGSLDKPKGRRQETAAEGHHRFIATCLSNVKFKAYTQ
jgi:hypothetical protein